MPESLGLNPASHKPETSKNYFGSQFFHVLNEKNSSHEITEHFLLITRKCRRVSSTEGVLRKEGAFTVIRDLKLLALVTICGSHP